MTLLCQEGNEILLLLAPAARAAVEGETAPVGSHMHHHPKVFIF